MMRKIQTGKIATDKDGKSSVLMEPIMGRILKVRIYFGKCDESSTDVTVRTSDGEVIANQIGKVEPCIIYPNNANAIQGQKTSEPEINVIPNAYIPYVLVGTMMVEVSSAGRYGEIENVVITVDEPDVYHIEEGEDAGDFERGS